MIRRLITCLLLAGCVAHAPILPNYDKPAKLATLARRQQPVEFLTSKQKADYLVRINFVLLKKEVEEHPEIVDTLRDAIIEWSAYLPLEVMITVDQTDFPIGLLSPRAISGAILVRITDIQAEPIDFNDNILGAYDGVHNVLYIDNDGKDLERLYFVGLHELGHAFGLSHVFATGDGSAPAGSIMVSENFANNIMVPAASLYKGNKHPTLLEVKLAREYMRMLVSPFAFSLQQDQCRLQ